MKLCADCRFSEINGSPVRPKLVCTKVPGRPICVNARTPHRMAGRSVVARDCGPPGKLYRQK